MKRMVDIQMQDVMAEEIAGAVTEKYEGIVGGDYAIKTGKKCGCCDIEIVLYVEAVRMKHGVFLREDPNLGRCLFYMGPDGSILMLVDADNTPLRVPRQMSFSVKDISPSDYASQDWYHELCDDCDDLDDCDVCDSCWDECIAEQ